MAQEPGAQTAGKLRLKSVEQSIADTDEPDTKLRRDLNWWDLTVFGVLSLIHISEPTRRLRGSRMPSSA